MSNIENLELFKFSTSAAQIKNNFILAGIAHKKVIVDVLPKIEENMKLIDISALFR